MIRDNSRLQKLLSTTRTFVREVAIPNESRVERSADIPEDIVAQMRELGLFGWSIPQEYGGGGLSRGGRIAYGVQHRGCQGGAQC